MVEMPKAWVMCQTGPEEGHQQKAVEVELPKALVARIPHCAPSVWHMKPQALMFTLLGVVFFWSQSPPMSSFFLSWNGSVYSIPPRLGNI